MQALGPRSAKGRVAVAALLLAAAGGCAQILGLDDATSRSAAVTTDAGGDVASGTEVPSDASRSDAGSVDSSTMPDACDGQASCADAGPADRCADAGKLTDGLIGYWPFDGTGEDKVSARDLSMFGDASFDAGRSGLGLSMPGTGGGYAARPANDTAFDLASGDFTIQIWVKLSTALYTEQVFVEKFSGSQGPGWTLLKMWNNELEFYANPTTVVMSGATNITVGVWHHIAARRAGTKFDVIYDGVVTASGDSDAAVPVTGQPLLVGRRNSGASGVDGTVDDLAIWSRALSDAEIGALVRGECRLP